MGTDVGCIIGAARRRRASRGHPPAAERIEQHFQALIERSYLERLPLG